NLGQNLILNFFGNGFALHDFPFGTNYCALGKDKVSSFSGTCPPLGISLTTLFACEYFSQLTGVHYCFLTHL
ncbi:MAG: hypothetical protein ACOZAN_03975, partial [Patescibacteria group bacterium]